MHFMGVHVDSLKHAHGRKQERRSRSWPQGAVCNRHELVSPVPKGSVGRPAPSVWWQAALPLVCCES